MSGVKKSHRMLAFINYRMRVTMTDGRTIIGKLMAFDKHMNLVLGDAEEFRKRRPKVKADLAEEKRTLGLIILRGENVVALACDGPAPAKDTRFKPTPAAVSAMMAAVQPGGGMAMGVGRGMPMMAVPPSMPAMGVGRGAVAGMPPQFGAPGMMQAPPAFPMGAGRGGMPMPPFPPGMPPMPPGMAMPPGFPPPPGFAPPPGFPGFPGGAPPGFAPPPGFPQPPQPPQQQQPPPQ